MANTNTRRVVLATDWTTDDGRPHKGGASILVPVAEARNLVHVGKARFAEDVEKDAAPKSAPVESGKTDDKKKGE